ncbi:hypothetical protein ACFQ7M_12105 [Streptomyces massasporeus]
MPIHRPLVGIAPGVTPAVGDEILARKSPVAPLLRARVRNVRPSADGSRVRIGVVWLEGERCGERGSVYQSADGWPPMVRLVTPKGEEGSE